MAPEKLGDGLLADLSSFRVETFVVDPVAVAGPVPTAVTPGPGSTPPTRPRPLRDAVEDVGARAVEDMAPPGIRQVTSGTAPRSAADLAALIERADQLAGTGGDPGRGIAGATSVRDPEAAARTADILRLVADLRPGMATPPATARLDGGGPPDGPAGPVALDHRAMRQLAKGWELGNRTVWCRTTMRLDGDIVTEMRAHSPEAEPVEALHASLVLAAIDHWKLLVVVVGVVAQVVGGLVTGAAGGDLRNRWRPLPTTAPAAAAVAEVAPAGVRRIGLRELARRSIRLLALGRVVFESPAPGAAAQVRTMLLAAGDLEVTILSPRIDPQLLVDHAALVTRWLAELAHGFTVWRARLLRGADAVTLALATVLAIVNIAVWPPDLTRLVISIIGAALPEALAFGARRWLRWRLRSLLHRRDRVVVLPVA